MSNLWLILPPLVLLFSAMALWARLKNVKTTIRVSSHGDIQENRILIGLIRDFHEKHPRIRVELVRYPFVEYTRKVLDSLENGTGPDVLMLEVAHYTEIVFDDVLEPVYPYFLDDHMKLTDFYPQVVDRFFLNGFLNAVPRDTAPICMVYYNKKAFDEAGVPYPQDDWNWDRFVETAKKVMKYDVSGRVTRWGFVEGWAMLEGWVYNAGGSYADNIKNPRRWTFAEDRDTLRGLQFRWDLIHKHQVMPPPSVWTGFEDAAGAEMFADGKAAMYLCGLWKTPRFREIRDFEWDAAMMPRDNNGHLDFGISASAYGISKASRNKKTAWKFIKYVSGEQGSAKLAENGLSQPALMNVANSPAFLDQQAPRNKKLLLDAMKRGKFAPLCKNWPEIKSLVDSEFTLVWEKKRTIEEAMQRLKPMLEKNPPLVH